MSTVTISFVTMQCGGCGVFHGLEHYHHEQLVKEGGSFCCPNGCKRTFAESEAQRLRKKLAATEARLDRTKAARDYEAREREAADRRASAARGQVTKIKNRVKNGVCPCCSRHFTNLQRHIETKHPGWTAD